MNILGLMSGTSMDGVDICIANLEIDKNDVIEYKIIIFPISYCTIFKEPVIGFIIPNHFSCIESTYYIRTIRNLITGNGFI